MEYFALRTHFGGLGTRDIEGSLALSTKALQATLGEPAYHELQRAIRIVARAAIVDLIDEMQRQETFTRR